MTTYQQSVTVALTTLALFLLGQLALSLLPSMPAVQSTSLALFR